MLIHLCTCFIAIVGLAVLGVKAAHSEDRIDVSPAVLYVEIHMFQLPTEGTLRQLLHLSFESHRHVPSQIEIRRDRELRKWAWHYKGTRHEQRARGNCVEEVELAELNLREELFVDFARGVKYSRDRASSHMISELPIEMPQGLLHLNRPEQIRIVWVRRERDPQTAILKALKQRDERFLSASFAAAFHGADSPEIIAALITALDDAEAPQRLASDDDLGWKARASAAYALGEIGAFAKDAVPRLIKLASDDPNLSVRRHAALALGKMGTSATSALETLQRVAETADNAHLRQYAAEAISQIKTSK